MVTSKILLLSLIAISCFQVQNARVIRDDISDDFNKAVETLNKSLSAAVGLAVTIIGEVEQQVILVAVLDLDVFYKDMEALETQANSVLEELNVSETCANKAAALLVKLSSDIRSNVADFFGEHKEENKGIADVARRTLLGEFLGYPGRLVEEFQACQDDECRKERLAEANEAIGVVDDEVEKVLMTTLEAQEQLMIKFEEERLIKSEEEYKIRAKEVIEEAEKCVDA